MLSYLRQRQSLRRAIWIIVILLSVPAIAYAADYIVNSGEFVGLGSAHGRLVFTEHGAVDSITFRDSNVGINVITPGQRLHLGDGNMLIESGGETAVKIKRDIIIHGRSFGG